MTEIERKALALVERLRRNELRIQEGINELCGSAADRIEAQAAEIKAILDREADTYRRHDAKVDALEAENERLRGEVQSLTDELGYHGIYPRPLLDEDQ